MPELKPKKQTELMRFRDYLLYATATKAINADDIMNCYLEFTQKLHNEKVSKMTDKLIKERER